MAAPAIAPPAAIPVVERATRGRAHWYGWLFWPVLALMESFVFTLPLFPNGDGPVHIYLSTILGRLATGSSPFYAQFYAIRHLVQPYSFHYYLLILLGHGMPADMAEKCFVGLILLTVAACFRSLARVLAANGAPGTPAAALLVLPLLLSWPLSGGFFNFTFGCGLMLFALAIYYRLGGAARAPRLLAALFGTLFVLVLAHPIPIMVLICLVGLDLCFELAGGWQRERRLRLPGAKLAALAMACLAFVFPILIADKAQVASSLHRLHPHLQYLVPLLTGQNVSFFYVRSPLGWLYQGLIVAIVPACFLLFVRSGLPRRLRAGALGSGDRLLLSTLIFLAASLAFPDNMNGSALFAVRMWFMVWLVVAACMAALPLAPAVEKAVAGLGLAVALLSLLFAVEYLRPAALRQAELEHSRLLPSRERGLFFEPLNAAEGRLTHTWWAIGFWQGVRAFTAHDDVLVNTPWLQLTIVPVRENGHAGLMRDVTPGIYSENPMYMLDALRKHPEFQAQVLRLAQFVLFADPNSVKPDPLGFAANFLGPQAGDWACRRQDFFAVCERK